MRRNQKGFTIVELLVAVAILSIVVASVCGFILVGSRSYAAGNSDINVQQEAQLALNQMSDVLIDTTRSVNYVGYDAGGTTSEKALKDAEFSFTPEDKSLVMFNGVVEETPSAVPGGAPGRTVDPGNGNKHYHFYWSKQNETLYYAELPVQSTDVDTAAVASSFPTFDPADPTGARWVVLASHVMDFSVDLSQVEEKRVVQLSLTFLDGKKEYVTSNNVTIRNKVAVNDAEIEPVNKRKTISVAARDSGVIVEPGEEYHFSTPRVTGDNVTDRSVTWSVITSGSASGGTMFTDAANGILKVATDEPAGDVKVLITTNAVGSDGLPATCSVTVHIKRVRAVNLAKTADTDADNGSNEISPGCTFTISATVDGYKLDEVCNVCGDDTTIDRQVVYEGNPFGNPLVWIIHNPPASSWDPNNFIDIIESEADHATFYVHADAPTSIEGDAEHTYGAVIQCISLLSEVNNAYGRDYDNWVPGAIELKFVKGKKNIHMDGSLHWGSSTDVKWEELSPYHYYVICARIREYGTEGGDKIMLYLSEGTTTRVTPDLFGVEDVSKPWYLSLQVLNPGKPIPPGVGISNQLQVDVGAQVSDPTVLDIINEYLEDSSKHGGTYMGTKYLHTDKLETIIKPPEIFYEYNGKKNLGGELRLETASALAGPEWTQFRVDIVRNTRDETLGYWFANNNIKFSMYQEKDDGKLEKIYGYNAEGNYYEGDANPYDNALQLSQIQSASNVIIKLDLNKPSKLSEAAGKYRLIPTIIYEQGSEADHVGGASVYYVNYQPNYKKKQCYEDKKSTVYFELTGGGNLELWSYSNNEFTKGEIYFPAPSEAGFGSYFERENTSWHEAKKLDNFKKMVKGNSNYMEYRPSSMRCRYVSNSKTYELELFYQYWDSAWNRNVELSAGVYQYEEDQKRWVQKLKGTCDSQLGDGNSKPQVGDTANAEFWMGNNYYKGKIYIPLPSEDAFTNEIGFERKKNGVWQGPNGFTLKYQANGQQHVQQLGSMSLKCYYNAGNDEYTMQLWGWDSAQGQSVYITAFKCKSDGKRWTQQ